MLLFSPVSQKSTRLRVAARRRRQPPLRGGRREPAVRRAVRLRERSGATRRGPHLRARSAHAPEVHPRRTLRARRLVARRRVRTLVRRGGRRRSVCTRPARRRGLDLDGSLFGRAVTQGTPCPFLMLFAPVPWNPFDRAPPRFYPDRDQARLHEDSLFAHTRATYWLTVRGLDHMSFTDGALSPGPSSGWPSGWPTPLRGRGARGDQSIRSRLLRTVRRRRRDGLVDPLALTVSVRHTSRAQTVMNARRRDCAASSGP